MKGKQKQRSGDVISVSLYYLLIVNANSSFHDIFLQTVHFTSNKKNKVFIRLILALTFLLLPVINESFIAVLESSYLMFTVLFYKPQATLTKNIYMMEY